MTKVATKKKKEAIPETKPTAIALPKLEVWPIDALIPYALNSKVHDEKQISAIATAISRFGFDQPIVVDTEGTIIKGHGRRLACIQLGLANVPVLIREDLTIEQANAARIADNHVALGEFDTEMMRMELEALDLDDLRGIIDAKELAFLNENLTEMDTSFFADDLGEAVAQQDEITKDQISAAADKRIPIGKALGFKDVTGDSQLHINRFMAQIEESTNLKGDEAFSAFIKLLLEPK